MENYYVTIQKIKIQAVKEFPVNYQNMSFKARRAYWINKSLQIKMRESEHFFNLITKQDWSN